MANIRYLVDDVAAAVTFYTERLGFTLEQTAGPPFAIVARDDVRLMLTGPLASGSQPMPDGSTPEPGGWNRLVIGVDDLASLVAELRSASVSFRNDIAHGPFGSQVLIEDPAGNPIELAQPPDSA